MTRILTADDTHITTLSEMAREYWTEASPDLPLLGDEAALHAECQPLFCSKETRLECPNRRGVGRALVEDALSIAAAADAHYAGTAIEGTNQASFELFQAMGFGVNRYFMGRRGDLATPVN